MEPIDEKVKEAWRISEDIMSYPSSASPHVERWLLARLADGYVHERAMRMKAEHEKDCDEYIYPTCRRECPRSDADREAQVRKELEGEK